MKPPSEVEEAATLAVVRIAGARIAMTLLAGVADPRLGPTSGPDMRNPIFESTPIPPLFSVFPRKD